MYFHSVSGCVRGFSWTWRLKHTEEQFINTDSIQFSSEQVKRERESMFVYERDVDVPFQKPDVDRSERQNFEKEPNGDGEKHKRERLDEEMQLDVH